MTQPWYITPSAQAPTQRDAPAPSEGGVAGGQWLLAQVAAPPAAAARAQARGPALLGAVHLLPALGSSRARCHFHIGRVVHSAPELGLHQVQTTLQLGHDATGEAEISALYLEAGLAAAERDAVADALVEAALALLRQTLAAADPARAGDRARRVIVELPGWRDAQGRSPFFEGLVRPFLPPRAAAALGAATAWRRHGPALDTHLGAMLPRQLIHAAFLPPATQAALGRCASTHLPWQAALQRAGFEDWQHCRIEDGGPVLARGLG